MLWGRSNVGKVCKMLLLDQKFMGTMLPRIPIPIMKEIEKKLDPRSKAPTGRNSGASSSSVHHANGRDREGRDAARGSDGGRRYRSRSPARDRDRYSRDNRQYGRDERNRRDRSPDYGKSRNVNPYNRDHYDRRGGGRDGDKRSYRDKDEKDSRSVQLQYK